MATELNKCIMMIQAINKTLKINNTITSFTLGLDELLCQLQTIYTARGCRQAEFWNTRSSAQL